MRRITIRLSSCRSSSSRPRGVRRQHRQLVTHFSCGFQARQCPSLHYVESRAEAPSKLRDKPLV